MRQRVGLLARQDKAARSARASAASRSLTHLMAFPFRHEFGGAVQALFGLDHSRVVKRSSPRASLPSSTRSAHPHCAHHLVELVDAVAVPMRKLRQVAPREGRLLLGDRLQPKGRIGDDPRAIAPRDLAVQFGAVGLDPLASMPRTRYVRRRADLALRLQRDTLASRLRWSIRASMSSSARRSLASSAQRSRQRSTISVRFHSRTFWPKPFSSTCAWSA